MRKYSFRLDRVHQVRRTHEELAKAELQRANLAVQAAAGLVRQREAEYAQHASGSTGLVTNAVLEHDRHFADLSMQLVLAARAAYEAACVVAAEKAAAFTVAAQHVKALDRLNERAREDYAIEAQRAMDAELDDIVTSRHQHPSAGTAPRSMRLLQGGAS